MLKLWSDIKALFSQVPGVPDRVFQSGKVPARP